MRSGNSIPVLERAVQVVEYIGSHPGKVGRSELQKALGISQATCYRIVSTLLAKGWLSEFGGKLYDIGPSLPALARKALFRLDKYRILQPALDHLAKELGCSAKLSVRDGSDQVNVLCAQAPGEIVLTTAAGSRFALANGGSAGALLLAGMPEDERTAILKASPLAPEAQQAIKGHFASYRRDGFCFNPATGGPGATWSVDALSVPVKDRGGAILGVLTIISPPGALAKARRKPLAGKILKASEFFIDAMA